MILIIFFKEIVVKGFQDQNTEDQKIHMFATITARGVRSNHTTVSGWAKSR